MQVKKISNYFLWVGLEAEPVYRTGETLRPLRGGDHRRSSDDFMRKLAGVRRSTQTSLYTTRLDNLFVENP
ncbi:hypothetical protein [Nostoc sp.]|uniref:hypothetical protein n=1 Tax=Nostoc sp. TaxID=1180 RepID=UPI002FFB2C84